MIGHDDRMRVSPTTAHPWRTVTKLEMTFSAGEELICSGAVVDSFHVVTAGHCLYPHEYKGTPIDGWATAVRVVPGMDAGAAPFGEARATLMRSYPAWIEHEDFRDDLALLTLDRCVGETTGAMELRAEDAWWPKYAGRLHTAGYPGDLDGGKNLYYTTDWGRQADRSLHRFSLDVMGGQSGSPVWVEDGGAVIVSIVSHADLSRGDNVGTRISHEKLDSLMRWMDKDYPTAPCVYPELVAASSGFSPTIMDPNVRQEVWVRVANRGTAPAGAFSVAFYVSADADISPSDVRIGVARSEGIPIGGSQTLRWEGASPVEIWNGPRWVGWILDEEGEVEELNEGNNRDSSPTTIPFGPQGWDYLLITVVAGIFIAVTVVALVAARTRRVLAPPVPPTSPYEEVHPFPPGQPPPPWLGPPPQPPN